MLEETKLEELNIVELEERFEPVAAAEAGCITAEEMWQRQLMGEW